MTKKIILQIARERPSKKIPITEKPVNRFASQTTWLASKQCEQPLKGFMRSIKLICKWYCNNIPVIVKIIYNLKDIAWRSISIILGWAALFWKKSIWDYIKSCHNIEKLFKLGVTGKMRNVSEQSMSWLWASGSLQWQIKNS